MKLEHDFGVDAELTAAWPLLLDLERIAPCMPGAQLQEVDGDEYRGIVKVKVGPITAQYRGAARVVEADEATRRVVLHAEGRDTRGQGNAAADIVATLTADGARTQVHVDTELNVTGKVAQFGRGVMADVSAKLMDQFVACLSTTILDAGDTGAADTADPPGPAAACPAAPPSPAAPPARPHRPRHRRAGRGASKPSRRRPSTWSAPPAGPSPSASCRSSPRRSSSSASWSGSSPAERSATRRRGARSIEYVFDPDGPVLGIDPGLSTCGYGAVERHGRQLTAVACGVLRTSPDAPLPERLATLEADLDAFVREVRPAALAVERILFQANVRTAISVGQASGLALVVAARAGVPVTHYSPNEVKLAVAGDGAAAKVQVQHMIQRLLEPRVGAAPRRRGRARPRRLPSLARPAPRRRRPGRRRRAGPPMIGSLRGTVLEYSPAGEVVLEVGGVGYRVLVPTGTAGLVPGDPAFLFTHLHVREDALILYGFPTRDARDTFETLLGATGVGPKLALAICSVHGPAALRQLVLDGDVDALTLVPGVGKRTAQRLLLELQARLEVAARTAPTATATHRSDGRSATRSPASATAPTRYATRSSASTATSPPSSCSATPCAVSPAPGSERGRRARGAAPTRRRSGRTGRRDDAAAPPAHRLRRPAPPEGAPRDHARRRPASTPGRRPSPPRRPARGRQDHPRRDRRRRARRRAARHERPRARTRRGRRRHPLQPRRRRGPLHRRDPPAAPRRRGGAVPRDGGLRARHRPRPRPLRPVDPPRPAPLHAHRRDDPQRDDHRPAARPVRVRRPPRLLRTAGPRRDPGPLGEHPRRRA